MMEVMRMQRCKEELHVHFVQWFILTLRAVIVGAFARMVQNHLHPPPEFNMEQNVVWKMIFMENGCGIFGGSIVNLPLQGLQVPIFDKELRR
jgi:hypothetical protein